MHFERISIWGPHLHIAPARAVAEPRPVFLCTFRRKRWPARAPIRAQISVDISRLAVVVPDRIGQPVRPPRHGRGRLLFPTPLHQVCPIFAFYCMSSYLSHSLTSYCCSRKKTTYSVTFFTSHHNQRSLSGISAKITTPKPPNFHHGFFYRRHYSFPKQTKTFYQLPAEIASFFKHMHRTA